MVVFIRLLEARHTITMFELLLRGPRNLNTAPIVMFLSHSTKASGVVQ